MAKTTAKANRANLKSTNSKSERASRSMLRPVIVVALLAALAIAGVTLLRSDSKEPGKAAGTPAPASVAQSVVARQVPYTVVNSYPHDRNAFLQGLLWHNGSLYESTGIEGRSSLRRLDFPSGKVEKIVNLSPDLFGEGLALVDNRLVQLTWKSQKGFVYDLESFSLLREFNYRTEGWGITFDGKDLIMSDGSNVLTYLDPQTFEPHRKLAVTINNRPLDLLNELEFIRGEIWANVWQSDLIVRIDPNTGQVTSFLNLRGILPPEMRTGGEDVLNGIAYDEHEKRIFVSGKLWPRVFEIQVND